MQQINLLAGELLPKTEPLVARHFVAGWGVLALLLAVITAWHGISLWILQGDLQAAQSELATLRSANATGRANVIDPEALRQQVSELQARQSEQSALMALLQAEQQVTGFSAYLTSLAEARVEGLWLNEILIAHNATRQLTLKGATVDAVHVPELLQNLANETLFAGQRFEQIDLSADDDEQTVQFAIVSPQGEPSG